jgi:hypothetical protein
LAVSLLLCATAAAEPVRGALVIVAVPDEARANAVRTSLAARYRMVDAAPVREALEQIRRETPAEERVRETLLRARQRLRKFDQAGLARTLDEARQAAAALPPTSEGRMLLAEVSVCAAEAASLAGDSGAAARHMREALGAEPELLLDPVRYPPALVELGARVRSELARQPEVPIEIASTPPGARVFAAGNWRGETPLRLSAKPGPLMVWLVRDGFRPTSLRIDGPAPVPVVLVPLDERARLVPLVEAVRRAGGEARRQAALALAAALDVSVIAVLDGGETPIEYRREQPQPERRVDLVEQPRAATPKAWYKRGWVWGVVASSVIVVAVVAGVAGYYGQKEEISATCCR